MPLYPSSNSLLAGQELAYAERTTNFTTTNTTLGSNATASKIGGLVCTVVGTGQPVDIEWYGMLVNGTDTASLTVDLYLLVNGVYTGTAQLCQVVVTNAGLSKFMKRRLVLTAGTNYTFEIGYQTNNGAKIAGLLASTDFPTTLSVTSR